MQRVYISSADDKHTHTHYALCSLIHIYCYSFLFMWKSSHRALNVSVLFATTALFSTTVTCSIVIKNKQYAFSVSALSWVHSAPAISDIANVRRASTVSIVIFRIVWCMCMHAWISGCMARACRRTEVPNSCDSDDSTLAFVRTKAKLNVEKTFDMLRSRCVHVHTIKENDNS